MLVQRRAGSLRLIRQNDHGLLTGRLAQEWIGFGAPAPLAFPDVLAIALHDLAWAEADREPVFDPATGGVRSFRDWTDPEREPMQSAGLDLVERLSPRAALIGSLHYARFLDPEEYPAYARREGERRARTRVELDLAEDDAIVERTRGLLVHLDLVSLLLCLGDPGALDPPDWLAPRIETSAPAPYSLAWRSEREVACDPFPFRAEFEVACPYREIAAPLASAGDLRAAWRSAAPRFLSVRITRG
ncbi:MAG: DUF3891 family protein [bacterium]